eukprot:490115_1
MGGENEATSPFTGFNYFEIYDIINLRWTIGQPLPRNRRYAACATISDYVYLYGGKNIYADASITDIDRIYIGNMTSIATQPWEPSVATMNGFNTNFAKAVVSNDLVYIMGGVNITDGRDGIIQVMDINANMYTISVKLNTYRSSPGVIIVNNVIYIFGGSTDIGNTDSFEYSNVLTFAPTNHPTYTTNTPTSNPTYTPTSYPTSHPTTSTPTSNPTYAPTNHPSTSNPTSYPTIQPTKYPSHNPTIQPTMYPSVNPTLQPTKYPTNYPTANPTNQSIIYPTNSHTFQPSYTSSAPTNNPTFSPTIYEIKWCISGIWSSSFLSILIDIEN